jgi:DNA-binding NarL/FixJ family response regulator
MKNAEPTLGKMLNKQRKKVAPFFAAGKENKKIEEEMPVCELDEKRKEPN